MLLAGHRVYLISGWYGNAGYTFLDGYVYCCDAPIGNAYADTYAHRNYDPVVHIYANQHPIPTTGRLLAPTG